MDSSESEKNHHARLMPEISIFMSTYNRNGPGYQCENLLKRAISSITIQTFRDFELVLIDDASTDGTHLVCEQAAREDARIRFVRKSNNSGALPAARYNEAIYKSRGRFILSMFDDDELAPNALQDLYHAITRETPDSGMVYGYIDYIDTSTGEFIAPRRFGENYDFARLTQGNFIANLSFLVKRDVLNDVGA